MSKKKTPALTATEVFAVRLKEARAAAGLSQEKLAKRVQEVVGYELKRGAIAEIELGTRGVSLDEWLALSAALAVCPLYMVTPLEADEPLNEEQGSYLATMELQVGKLLPMLPVEARRWIRGTAIHYDAPVETWRTYYCDQVPPAYRYQLRRLADWVRAHSEKLGRWTLPEPIEPLYEELTPQLGVPGYTDPEGTRGFPAPLWTYLMSKEATS